MKMEKHRNTKGANKLQMLKDILNEIH